MADFLPAVRNTLKWEGSNYTDYRQDKGGGTKFGITENFDYVIALKRKLIPINEHIKDLTEEQAITIYRELYWNMCPCLAKINKQILANKIFDEIVNLGEPIAVKILQTTLNDTFGCRLDIDGDLGHITLNAINSNCYIIILNHYKDKLCEYYYKIVKNNPEENIFLKGWLKRARS